MPLSLSPSEIEGYARDGFVAPVRAIEACEMAGYRERLEAIERSRAGRIPPTLNIKAHLVIPWLWDLVLDERIVGPVRDLLGPDLVCWAASFFAKGPGEAQHVPWHQDATYWGLSEPRALTAWIAFTPSVPENGCLRVVPGSHLEVLGHRDTHDAANMLPGREEVAVDVDEGAAHDVRLRPGEMSLHHPLIVHGSKPNTGDIRRVGFAIRYIAGDVEQVGSDRVSATLVCGRDHGCFDLEEPPEGEFHPDALRRHAALTRKWMRMVSAEVSQRRG
jgi:hypothetical protein